MVTTHPRSTHMVLKALEMAKAWVSPTPTTTIESITAIIVHAPRISALVSWAYMPSAEAGNSFTFGRSVENGEADCKARCKHCPAQAYEGTTQISGGVVALSCAIRQNEQYHARCRLKRSRAEMIPLWYLT